MTINATGAIGALMLEIGIPADIMRAIAVVSRCGGLPGHILEELGTPTARTLWALAEEYVPYEAGRGGRVPGSRRVGLRVTGWICALVAEGDRCAIREVGLRKD